MTLMNMRKRECPNLRPTVGFAGNYSRIIKEIIFVRW